MYVGMLYNTFVCLVSGITSLVVFLLLRKTRKKKKREYSEGLDYFVLLLGLLWVFVGLRIFFAWLDKPDLDLFVFRWFSGPLTYLHLIPLFYYFGWSLFKNKKIRLLSNIFFTSVALLTVFTFFKYGLMPGEVTYWGTDPIPNPLTNKLFVYGLFLPTFLFIIIDFIRRLRAWRRTGDPTERQLFGFTFGLSIYALIGVFDALAAVQDWRLLLFRIGIMVAPLIFYLSATWETEE